MSSYTMLPVPTDRVPEIAKLIYGASEAKPQRASSYRTADEIRSLVRRVYLDSEPTFRRLLLLLAERDNPAEPMLNGAVSEAMGWSTARSLPGALGAYGRRAKHRYEGFWPIARGWDYAHESHTLAMEPDLAEQLRELHAERGLPTS